MSPEVTAGRAITPLAFPSCQAGGGRRLLVNKEDLRRKLLRERKSLQLHDRRQRDLLILSRLLSLKELEDAGKILLFYPVKGEPDIRPLFDRLLKGKKVLVFPRVSGPELELVSVSDINSLRKGAFGIPEPSSGEVVSPQELELAIVPGVAFDRRGYRLGFGKGYYDRVLRHISAPKVGVAYSFQVVEYIPQDEWDVPVDILITDKEVIRWKR